jgi:glycosyltransferase involved in cell wall biosynthesis
MNDSDPHPTVTVIIPCFNQARFLPAAVSSVRAQRYERVECIVVNDGSTDGTAAVASTLGVPVIEQSNKGVSEARNAGLTIARGELVVFLDADDELLPDAVALGAAALESNRMAAAVVGRCQPMNADGDSLPAVHDEVNPSNLYTEWLMRNFVWTPGAAMFRRDVLVEIGGFPAGLGPAADYGVYLRLARTRRVHFLANDLVRYRQHDGNMSRDPALMLRSTLAVLRRESRDAPPSARVCLAHGRRRWREWYGEQIVHRLRADWHAGRRGWEQVRMVATLVRHGPSVALRHIVRKAARVVTALWHRAQLALRHLVRGRPGRTAP